MSSQRNKRIAKNTLLLFGRQLLMLFVSLYTVRIVLLELGVKDYGVFSAIGGLVALSAFLPGSLAQATQRYFSFALGAKDENLLRRTFSMSLVLYGAVGLAIFILLQTIGLWFVNHQLILPEGRFESAKILYNLSCLTFLASVVVTPFIAIIMAHEDMDIYAYISIIEALMKLGVALFLQWVSWDKLELYGFLLLIVGVINAAVYVTTCFYRYPSCQIKTVFWDRTLLKQMAGFTGWTIFGQISTISRTHAITILLNQFFNPAVVAARAISMQIAAQVNIFSINFNSSLYPAIIKTYAENEKQEMFFLINMGSKLTFFLLWIFALPMIVEMDFILTLWLPVVPQAAVLFSQLALVEAVIMSISLPLTAAARAPGKMREYELVLGSIQISILVVAWIIVGAGYPPYSVFIIAIIANMIMFGLRLYLVNRLIDFPAGPYLKATALPLSVVVMISATLVCSLDELLPIGILGSAVTIASSFALISATMYFIGLSGVQRENVRAYLSILIQRLRAS